MTQARHASPLYRRLAVLDVDGTLYRGALGIDLLGALIDAEACDPVAARKLLSTLEAYREGRIDHATMSRRAYRAFGLALAGREHALVETIARDTWHRVQTQMFGFAEPLVELLRELGYTPAIISGSPQTMVNHVAASLGIQIVYGANFGVTAGRYDGRVCLAPGASGGKARVLEAIATLAGTDLSKSLAIGDSVVDGELFDMVGHGIAFQPEPELERRAANTSWSIASASDVLDVVALRHPHRGASPQEALRC